MDALVKIRRLRTVVDNIHALRDEELLEIQQMRKRWMPQDGADIGHKLGAARALRIREHGNNGLVGCRGRGYRAHRYRRQTHPGLTSINKVHPPLIPAWVSF
jgi:hypothetical protein